METLYSRQKNNNNFVNENFAKNDNKSINILFPHEEVDTAYGDAIRSSNKLKRGKTLPPRFPDCTSDCSLQCNTTEAISLLALSSQRLIFKCA